MENMNELNVNQLEEVSGGKYGGYSKKPPERAGCKIIKIASGDNLGKIARRNGTTVEVLMALNSAVLDNPNQIMAGYYLYVPA